LDRALEVAFPALPSPCERCGAPNPSLGLVIVLQPDDEILGCPACGGSVTRSGVSLTSISPAGYLKVIYLEHDPPGL